MKLMRWQAAVRWPLAIAAVLFLIAYSVEVLADLQGPASAVPEIVIWTTWVLFLVDYIVSLILAERRGRWFITHLFDLLVVVLPMLRPLRLLRLVTLVSVLQRSAGRHGLIAAVCAVCCRAAEDAEVAAPGRELASAGPSGR